MSDLEFFQIPEGETSEVVAAAKAYVETVRRITAAFRPADAVAPMFESAMASHFLLFAVFSGKEEEDFLHLLGYAGGVGQVLAQIPAKEDRDAAAAAFVAHMMKTLITNSALLAPAEPGQRYDA